MKKRTKRQRAIIRRRIFIAVLTILLALIIALLSLIIAAINKTANNSDYDNKYDTLSQEEIEPQIDFDTVIAQATVVNTGDIIIHSPVLDGAKLTDGNYDFSALFCEVENYFKEADFATANLEITLGGTESGVYTGYPAFNTPDSLLDAVKSSGINFLTTANNHCYDTGFFGLKRTAQQLKLNEIEFTGTKELETDPTYIVKDINGIKIGMVSYTYENTCQEGQKSINGNIIKSEANAFINSFNYERIDSFYAEAQEVIGSMKQLGAEAIVFYMHWGEEYQLSPNVWQKSIAQKLCNFGVDVIVGGHPHVVQPVELIYSEDSQNTTVCIYSMGNAISNQRQELMDSCPTGHTEDGVLFYYTFQKYGDGTVALCSVDIIPTWVNKYQVDVTRGYQYTMYPLETPEMANDYFDAAVASKAQKSFERTKSIIAEGLYECQQYLGCEVRFEKQEVE